MNQLGLKGRKQCRVSCPQSGKAQCSCPEGSRPWKPCSLSLMSRPQPQSSRLVQRPTQHRAVPTGGGQEAPKRAWQLAKEAALWQGQGSQGRSTWGTALGSASTWHVLGALHTLTHLLLSGRNYYLHLTDGETKAQREKETCLRPQSK